MKIVNQLLVVKQQGGGGVDNPLIATTETEMTNYLNDTTKVGMFVKYTGPQTTNYFHNGIYQITTENNVAVFSYYTKIEPHQQLIFNFSNSTLTAESVTLIPIDYEDTGDYCITEICRNLFHGGKSGDLIPLTDNIKTITVPEKTTVLEDVAFYNCYGLTSISLPSSLTFIGGRAFGNCRGLTEITIPVNVTEIGDGAFQLGSAQNNVVYHVKPIQPPILGVEVFRNDLADIKIYVPKGSLEAYKTSTNWAEYATMIYAE